MAERCASALVHALVLAFDARQTIFGGLTQAHKGLVIRAWDSAQMRATARTYVEIRGGRVDLDQVLGSRLSITLEPEEVGPDRWKGWIRFNEPSKLGDIPLMRAIRQVREASSRAVVQYEGGGGTMRLDLLEPPSDPMGFLSDLRAHLVKNGITASLRMDDFKEPLEAWKPQPLILP